MTEHERRELEPPATPLKRGDKGPKVRQVQEWLTLHGFGTAIDGGFGPATEEAVRRFQQRWEGEDDVLVANSDGMVGRATWRALTEPMRHLVGERLNEKFPVGLRIVTFAQSHLLAGAREVGGPNCGPYIRGLYMDGHEGKDWPWCAGFATYVLSQALGHDKWRTFSCDELAAMAQRRGQFMRGALRGIGFGMNVSPGDLFLVRRVVPEGALIADWSHCGIVTEVGAEHFETIEGNTNQGGSREGTEVCKRVRAFNDRTDFILLGDGI